MRLLFVWFEETDKSVIEKFQLILELNSWARLFSKAYVIRTEKTAGEIRNQLKKHQGLNTMLFVVDITDSAWASFQVPSMITDAIKTWQRK
jgi:DNA/RNA-binding domain of Phe-tRNA-synthetase-like protein